MKLVEYVSELVLRNTDTGVSNLEYEPGRCWIEIGRHGYEPGERVLECVAEKIVHNLLVLVTVHPYDETGRKMRDVHLVAETSELRARLECTREVRSERAYIGRPERKRHPPSLRTCECQDIIHEAKQPLGVSFDHAELLTDACAQFQTHEFAERSEDERERCSKFVRDVCYGVIREIREKE
jgi:hypothetical protein